MASGRRGQTDACVLLGAVLSLLLFHPFRLPAYRTVLLTYAAPLVTSLQNIFTDTPSMCFINLLSDSQFDGQDETVTAAVKQAE